MRKSGYYDVSGYAVQNINNVFGEFACEFLEGRRRALELVQSGELMRPSLDYSVESLKAVDDYLCALHRRRPEVHHESHAAIGDRGLESSAEVPPCR